VVHSLDVEVHLVVVASTRPRTTRELERLARQLEIADRVIFLHRLDKEDLAGWLRHATATLAPLTECARNLEQGCCPLKVLESMAAGVPVLASNLPAVRELLVDGVDGTLLTPDRPAVWSRAIVGLFDDLQGAKAMARTAQQKVEGELSWDRARAELRAVYDELLSG